MFHIRQFVNSSVRKLAESLLACMGEEESDRFLLTIKRIEAHLVNACFPQTQRSQARRHESMRVAHAGPIRVKLDG